MGKLFGELKRRNVFRAGALYVVAGWLLMQVADILFGLLDVPGWGLRLVLGLLILGFPLVLIFSWVYELTPEGIKRESEIDRSQSVTQQTGHKLNIAIVVLLAAAVTLLALDRVLPGSGTARIVGDTPLPDSATQEEPTPKLAVSSTGSSSAPSTADDAAISIAVLPFVNMSRDPDNEYFSDGIAEELLNSLVKVKGLRVASRTSSFSFKDQNAPIPEIAARLKVDHVLEGSVRKAGNRVRITAQLIEVDSDSHLWSETYDRDLEDIFAVQTEISTNIVEALKVALDTGEVEAMSRALAPTDNLDAYNAYLEGRHFLASRGVDNLRKAAERLERAVALDPLFSEAHATLAQTYGLLPAYDLTAGQAIVARADAHLDRALALDPGNATALNVKGYVATFFKLDWEAARRSFERALAISPNDPEIHNLYGDFLVVTGDYAAAERSERRAMELDPLAEVHARDYAELMILMDRPDEAIASVHRALDLKLSAEALDLLIRALIAAGDLPAARDVLARYESLVGPEQPDYMLSAARLALADGDTGAFRKHYSRLRELEAKDAFSPATTAYLALAADGVDAVLPLLERALAQQDPYLAWPGYVYLPEEHSTDPRWLAFWQQPGLEQLIELRRRNRIPQEAI